MKKLIYLSVLLSFLSCNDFCDGSSKDLSILRAYDIEYLLPLESIKGSKYALFNNAIGDEIKFELDTDKVIKERIIKGKVYEAEEYEINYKNPDDLSYTLNVIGSGNYSDLETSNLYVSCILTQFVTGYTPLISIDEDGSPILAVFDNQLTLNGRKFTNVYSNMPIDEYDRFGRIYYTPEFGVVGFVDGEGSLYSLKEFQN